MHACIKAPSTDPISMPRRQAAAGAGQQPRLRAAGAAVGWHRCTPWRPACMHAWHGGTRVPNRPAGIQTAIRTPQK